MDRHLITLCLFVMFAGGCATNGTVVDDKVQHHPEGIDILPEADRMQLDPAQPARRGGGIL